MLTTAQLQALKTSIAADPAFNGVPMTSSGAYSIAAAYNVVGTTDVWRTDAPVSAVFDAIDWTKYTPTDAIPTGAASTTDGSAMTWYNRAIAINIKQMNLQNMLIGRSTIDASKANIRAGLRDATIALPAGANGNSVTAGGTGGANVLAALMRKGTRAEVLFSSGDATTGASTAKILVFEGQLSSDDVQAARELP